MVDLIKALNKPIILTNINCCKNVQNYCFTLSIKFMTPQSVNLRFAQKIPASPITLANFI